MDKRCTAPGTVTVQQAHLARNRHAGRAAEDLVLKLPPQPHPVKATAPAAGADLLAAVIAAAGATAQDVAKYA